MILQQYEGEEKKIVRKLLLKLKKKLCVQLKALHICL